MLTRLLIYFILWSGFFSFLYMNLLVFIIFIITSTTLILKERQNLLFLIGKYRYSIYSLFIYLILCSLPFVVFYNYSTIIYFLLTLWSIFLALIFLKRDNLEYFYYGIKYLLFIFIIILLIYIYSTDGLYPAPYRLDYMIGNNVSGNGPTSFLNILVGVYTALRFKLRNKSSLIVSFISLYIVIEGYGRGSIIFMFIIIIINFIFIYFNLKNKFKYFFILIPILIFIIWGPVFYDILQNTKLASGFESPRTVMLYEYLNKIDAYSLFFGASYENTVIAREYDNNPHITYIRTHHIFGLFYLFGLIYIIMKITFYTISNRNLIDWMILLVIFNILIRTISEPLLFPTIFDSFFLVLVFLITKKIKKGNI